MSVSDDGELIHCDEPDCLKTVKNHQWGKTKAEGWFFTRDGKLAYCPEHEPVFVKDWRAKKRKKDL